MLTSVWIRANQLYGYDQATLTFLKLIQFWLTFLFIQFVIVSQKSEKVIMYSDAMLMGNTLLQQLPK